jgi:hypothetical protein
MPTRQHPKEEETWRQLPSSGCRLYRYLGRRYNVSSSVCDPERETGNGIWTMAGLREGKSSEERANGATETKPFQFTVPMKLSKCRYRSSPDPRGHIPSRRDSPFCMHHSGSSIALSFPSRMPDPCSKADGFPVAVELPRISTFLWKDNASAQILNHLLEGLRLFVLQLAGYSAMIFHGVLLLRVTSRRSCPPWIAAQRRFRVSW